MHAKQNIGQYSMFGHVFDKLITFQKLGLAKNKFPVRNWQSDLIFRSDRNHSIFNGLKMDSI